jgi:hypothetical protein
MVRLIVGEVVRKPGSLPFLRLLLGIRHLLKAGGGGGRSPTSLRAGRAARGWSGTTAILVFSLKGSLLLGARESTIFSFLSETAGSLVRRR